MALAESLARVAKEFIYARGQQFKDNKLANYIRRDLVEDGKRSILYRSDEYKLKGSAGARNWAAVPWLGYFDPIITESAQEGFYVVFLINPQTSEIFLSLNQGTIAIYKEYGEKQGLNVLLRRAKDIQDRLLEKTKNFDLNPIDLGSDESLPRGYEHGHALGFKFDAQDIHDQDVEAKLHAILDAYQTLISRGGLMPTEAMFEEVGSKDIEKCRRYVLSKRIERSPKVRRDVLAKRELVCETCGMDPKKDYDYRGRSINVPLDVHHLTELRGLAEGEKKRYRVPDDFAILCPNCHRIAHQQPDPSDMEMLKRQIRFKYLREIILT